MTPDKPEPPSLTDRAQMLIRIDRSLHKSFRTHCFHHETTMSDVVTKMLVEFLKKAKSS